jgi:hypothetical protein
MKPIIPISWGQDIQSASKETNLRRFCDQLLMRAGQNNREQGERTFSGSNIDGKAVADSAELFKLIQGGYDVKNKQKIEAFIARHPGLNKADLKGSIVRLAEKYETLRNLTDKKYKAESLTESQIKGVDTKTSFQKNMESRKIQEEISDVEADITRTVRSYTANFENDRTTAAKDLYEPAKKAYDKQMSKLDDLSSSIKSNEETIKALEKEKTAISTNAPGLKTISKAAQEERDKKITKLIDENNKIINEEDKVAQCWILAKKL